MTTSSVPLVLVVGASGNLGREVVPLLAAAGAAVRRFDRTRSTDASAQSVVGDLRDPVSLKAALADVDAVLLTWPMLEAAPAAPVVEALAASWARTVYVSSTAVRDGTLTQSDPIAQVHADVESMLHAAGLDPVVLRSDTLASNTRGWVGQLRAGDVVGGQAAPRTAVVDERDVAAAAVAALLDPTVGPGPHLLTGPTPLSRSEQVQVLAHELGRPLVFEPVAADLARTRLLADGRPPALVEALVRAAADRPASDLVTDHVERLTGRPARTYARWVSDHRDELTG